MKKLILSALLFGTLALLIQSCNLLEDNPINSGDDPVIEKILSQPLPSFSQVTNLNGIMATIQFSHTIQQDLKVDYVLGYAQFGSPTVDAGAVLVNGTALPLKKQGSFVYYNSFNPLSPSNLFGVVFNGSNHSWSVSGKNGIPALAESIESPKSFSLTLPESGKTYQKANGLQVKWDTGNSTSADLFMLFVTQAGGDVTPYSNPSITNNGSFTVPSASLSQFSGEVLVQLVKYRYSVKNVDSKNYVLCAEIVKSVNCNLQ